MRGNATGQPSARLKLFALILCAAGALPFLLFGGRGRKAEARGPEGRPGTEREAEEAGGDVRRLFERGRQTFRYDTFGDVVEHYDTFFGLGLTARQKQDLVEYLNSL